MKKHKKWKIFLIHHSHTDIGYTERQEKIMRYHYDFIRQAIDILDEIHNQKQEEYKGFVWQCENYWQVENFYKMADETYTSKFEAYVLSGEIGLSGNYLNLTELVSETVLSSVMDKMEQYGEKVNKPIVAGMSADINGMAWGCSDIFYEHGVRYLYSGLHTHHGMFPLYKKTIPFYWETPKGNKLLVWNGDHYQLGNDLFLAPHAGVSYVLNDEFTPMLEQNMILKESQEATEQEELEILDKRLRRYLKNLESEDYPYEFVPFLISGAVTDNSPPSKELAKRVNLLNGIYAGEITFEMSTLENFFESVEECVSQIPIYRGDWPDWWADGIGSTPLEVKAYREAVRKYHICEKLDCDGSLGSLRWMDKSLREQLLYAEHTWGYSSSVLEPWNKMVGTLELKKASFATNANTYAAKNLDCILAKKGEVTISVDRHPLYTVCNPHDYDMCSKAHLYIENWEYIDGIRFDSSMMVEVVDCLSGKIIPSQLKKTARSTQIEIAIKLTRKEERQVRLRLSNLPMQTETNYASIGPEGVEDLLEMKKFRQDESRIETDYFIVEVEENRGISSIIYKPDDSELLRAESPYAPMAGVYEQTKMTGSVCETRKGMGRKRKSSKTRRFESTLIDRKIVEKGEIYVSLELTYSLNGTSMYVVVANIYRHQPKIEFAVRVHKNGHLEPENLYIATPFTAGDASQVFIDKTGCIIRPMIDQLPGSCQDFYLVQNAVVWQDEKSVALILKDVPLIHLGSLEFAPVELCKGKDKGNNNSIIYSWAMNNFWETNFKADLGGFYEFEYTLIVEPAKMTEEIFGLCEAENEGFLAYYS